MIRPGYLPVEVAAERTADITVAHRQAGGVLTVSRTQYDEIETSLARALFAMNEVATRLAGGSPASAARVLNVVQSLASLVPADWREWSTDLCRVDFVLTGGSPRLIEVNAGCAVGGSIDAEAFSIASVDELREARHFVAPNSRRIEWACDLCLRHGLDVLYLPLWPWIHIPDPATYFESSIATAARMGVSLRLLPFDRFVDILRTATSPVVAVKMFATLDAIRAGIDLARLDYGPVSEKVIWLQTEEVAVLSSKALMAHPEVRRKLGSPDRHVVIPPTWILGPAKEVRHAAVTRKEQLVLKPLNDHGGRGIVFGRAVSCAQWAALLRSSASSGAVLQDVIDVDPVPMEIINKDTGARRDFSGGCAYGAYFVRGKMVGVLARVAGPSAVDKPINGATGAVLTTLVPMANCSGT